MTQSFVSGAKYEFWIVTSSGNKFPCVTSAPTTSTSHIEWWDVSYDHRKHTTITNNLGSTISSGYSVCLTMDTASLVSSGKMLSNGDDLRIVYWDGDSFTELDRDIIDMNTDLTQIWFKTQADIDPSGTDDSYDMYYGYSTVENPPENKKTCTCGMTILTGQTSRTSPQKQNIGSRLGAAHGQSKAILSKMLEVPETQIN